MYAHVHVHTYAQHREALPHSLTPLIPHTAHLHSLSTVLHVDPVVPVVPEALNAQVLLVVGGVGLGCSWLNEEAQGHLSLPRQD